MPNFSEEEIQSYCVHKENILLTAHMPQYVYKLISNISEMTIWAVLHETDL